MSDRVESIRQTFFAGELDKAINLALDFSSSNEDNPQIHHLLGNMYLANKQFKLAISSYKKSVCLDNCYVFVIRKIAEIYRLQLENYSKAIQYYEMYLNADKDCTQSLYGIGYCYYKKQDYEKALLCLEEVRLLDPNYQGLLELTAYCLLKSKKSQKALDYSENILRTIPESLTHLRVAAISAIDLGEYNKALLYLEQAIAQHQDDKDNLYADLATVYEKKQQFDKAIEICLDILSRKPSHLAALNELCQCYAIKGQINEAIALSRHILKEQGYDPTITMRLGIFQLLQGDFTNGWENYEARLGSKTAGIIPECLENVSRWQGEEKHNQTILVFSEQGSGDIIQFIRYVPLLRSKLDNSNRLIIYVRKPLLKLMQHCLPDYEMTDDLSTLRINCYVPMMSLPKIFSTDNSNIPKPLNMSALSAVSSKIVVRDNNKLNVGIAWTGSSENPKNYRRGMSYQEFCSALPVSEKINYHSLQFNGEGHDCPLKENKRSVTDHCHEIKSFLDSAAIINQLDLVITVDTAIAHLAASMGKPTWILINLYSCWRWLEERTDSPWYESVKLYRQQKADSWQSALLAVHDDLTRFK